MLAVADQGFTDIFSAHLDAYNAFNTALNTNLDGVCATVTIKIQQDIVMTRQGFEAELDINNGGAVPMENISVEILIFRHSDASLATTNFAIGQPTLSRITAIPGGSLAGGVTGSAKWLIIPESTAVTSDVPVQFDVGGRFSYTLDGEVITMPLFPETITVYPDARLRVNYFLQQQIIGDDPFTLDVVEISRPATLGMLITNWGNGTATQMSISSSQPQITSNEKGLLISFQLTQTYINDVPQGVGTLQGVQIGNIAPHTTASVRWDLISSLKGQFVSFNATFQNTNPLGLPELSLIDSVQTHMLLRTVDMGDDMYPDYLVDDVGSDMMPDHLYSSATGESVPVRVIRNFTAIQNMSTGIVQISVPEPNLRAGWFYMRLRLDNVVALYNSFNIHAQIDFARTPNITSSRRRSLPNADTFNSWVTSDTLHYTGGSSELFVYLHVLDLNDVTYPIVHMNYTLYIPPEWANSTAINSTTPAELTTTTTTSTTTTTTTSIAGATTTVVAETTTTTTTTTTAGAIITTPAVIEGTTSLPNTSIIHPTDASDNHTSGGGGGLDLLWLIIIIAVLIILLLLCMVACLIRHMRRRTQIAAGKRSAKNDNREMLAVINPLFSGYNPHNNNKKDQKVNPVYDETADSNVNHEYHYDETRLEASLAPTDPRLCENPAYGVCEGTAVGTAIEQTASSSSSSSSSSSTTSGRPRLEENAAYGGGGGLQRIEENAAYGEMMEDLSSSRTRDGNAINEAYGELPNSVPEAGGNRGLGLHENAAYGEFADDANASGYGELPDDDDVDTMMGDNYDDVQFAETKGMKMKMKMRLAQNKAAYGGRPAGAGADQGSSVGRLEANPGYVSSSKARVESNPGYYESTSFASAASGDSDSKSNNNNNNNNNNNGNNNNNSNNSNNEPDNDYLDVTSSP